MVGTEPNQSIETNLQTVDIQPAETATSRSPVIEPNLYRPPPSSNSNDNNLELNLPRADHYILPLATQQGAIMILSAKLGSLFLTLIRKTESKST